MDNRKYNKNGLYDSLHEYTIGELGFLRICPEAEG